MSSSKEGELSLGSLNQTRPVRSHTYIRPLFSNATPTASLHGPEIGLSVNPGGTVAAERLLPRIRPDTTSTKHAIAVARLIRETRASSPPLRWRAQITRR